MRIAYLKTNREAAGYVVHGLGLLSAISNKYGHESFWANGAVKQDNLPGSVDVVAITACSDAVPLAVSLAKAYKKHNKDIQVWVGGPHATFSPEDFEKHECFNYIVRGQGETVWEDFSQGKLPASRVVNGQYSDSLDKLPFVDRKQEVDYSTITESPPCALSHYPGPYRCVLAGRGCKYNCSFCKPGTDLIFGKNFQRRRSVKNVLAEIYNMKHFGSLFIHDDDLIEDEDWCREFISMWDGRAFLVQGRSDLIVKREELLKEMVKKGLAAMLIGFESGSDVVLKRLRKGTTRIINEKAAAICHKLGIVIQANMMFGTPYETKEDVESTISLIRDHLYPCVVSPAIYTPYPGSDLGKMCDEKGWNACKETFDYSRYFDGSKKLKEEALGYTYDWLYSRLERLSPA